MSIITKYSAYLRDNPQGYWFKRKLYGWGWVPVRWQGWVVVTVSVVLIVLDGVSLSATAEKGDPTQKQLLWFFAQLIFVIVVLLIICYWKGEKPRWQWGISNEEKE